MEVIQTFCVNEQTFAIVAEADGALPIDRQQVLCTFRAGEIAFAIIHCPPKQPVAPPAQTLKHPSGAQAYLKLLTARELQIVHHVTSGDSTKMISKKLHISEWTVSSHVRRIFLKLNVDTRAQMVHKCSLLFQASEGVSAHSPP